MTEQEPPKRKFSLANTMGFLTIGLGMVSIFIFFGARHHQPSTTPIRDSYRIHKPDPAS